MAVILFRDGASQKFDEYTFTERLKEGWSLSPEKPAPVVDVPEPAKIEVIDLDQMNKPEIEEYARNYNIELDRRMSKKNMIKSFNEQMK